MSNRNSRSVVMRTIALLVLLVSLIGIGILGGWLLIRHPPSTTPSSLSLIYRYRGHSSPIEAVAWSPDSKYLASTAANNPEVQVWNAFNGHRLTTYTGHRSGVLAIAWSPDGKRMASSGYGGIVQIWDAVNGEHPVIYKDHPSVPGGFPPIVFPLAWSPNNKFIALGDEEGRVQVWDAANGRSAYTYTVYAHSYQEVRVSQYVRAIAWSPNGKYIASAGDEGVVQVRDASNGHLISTYIDHKKDTGPGFTVAWSSDSQRIISASTEGRIHIWDAINGHLESQYLGYPPASWSPDGQYLTSASGDGMMQIRDATGQQVLYTYRPNEDVRIAIWSPSGKYIVVAGEGDNTVQVWQLPSANQKEKATAIAKENTEVSPG